MSKRIDGPRLNTDCVDTPKEAAQPLLAVLPPKTLFIEPCGGAGALVRWLVEAGHGCVKAIDIAPRSTLVEEGDASMLHRMDLEYADCIITNPPLTWKIAKPIIDASLATGLPAWLLLPVDWITHSIGC